MVIASLAALAVGIMVDYHDVDDGFRIAYQTNYRKLGWSTCGCDEMGINRVVELSAYL